MKCYFRSMLFFSHPVMSDSLQPHGPQDARPPCPLPSPEFCPSSCSLHQCCRPAISSSDALFFCLQSFPASGAFLVSQLLASGDQNTGTWASASILPMSIQGWFPLRLSGWSPCCQGPLRSLLQHHSSKASILWHSAFFTVHLSRPYWEDHSLDYIDLLGRVMSLLFNTLSSLVIGT